MHQRQPHPKTAAPADADIVEPAGVRFLTMREAMARTRYSRPSIYRLIQNSDFPRPRKMTRGGRILFRERDVEAWLASRPAAL